MTALSADLLQKFLLVAVEFKVMGEFIRCVLVIKQHPVVDLVLNHASLLNHLRKCTAVIGILRLLFKLEP